MKIFLLSGFILLMTFQAVAQAVTRDDEKWSYARKAYKYKKMKNTGTTLTVLGGILITTGAVLLETSSIEYYQVGNGPIQKTTHGSLVGGAIAFALGAAGIGSGIPLMIVGRNNQKKYDAKVKELTARVIFNSQAQGIAVRYRF